MLRLIHCKPYIARQFLPMVGLVQLSVWVGMIGCAGRDPKPSPDAVLLDIVPDTSDEPETSDQSADLPVALTADLSTDQAADSDLDTATGPDYGVLPCPPLSEAIFCSDGNPCTKDIYSPTEQRCLHEKLEDCMHQTCAADTDCDAGVCDTWLGRCVTCVRPYPWSDEVSGRGCAADERCVRNACRPAHWCTDDSSCAQWKQYCSPMGPGWVCVDCQEDSDCGTCGRCSQGSCLPLKGVCNEFSAPCNSGFYCSDPIMGECSPD